jgi:hypothetical protein
MRICFMARAISKYMEIKTELSIKRITDVLLKVTDVSLVHRITRKTETLRSPLPPEAISILERLDLSH